MVFQKAEIKKPKIYKWWNLTLKLWLKHLKQSSAPGPLSTLVTSFVLYSLTRATLMSPRKDETRVCGYMLWIYLLSTLENTDQNRIFSAFWQSSAPGALSTLVKSVVLYSLTSATLMSPGKDETRVCGYMLWIYSWSTLENTDDNRIFSVRSPHHKHFSKAQHLVLWALWWHQLFSTR